MSTKAQIYNPTLDAGEDYLFDLTLEDDADNPMDISGWTFGYTLIRKRDNVLVWNLVNADFSRPSTGRIQFTKTAPIIAAMEEGEYTLSLKVTGSIYNNDEFIIGTAIR